MKKHKEKNKSTSSMLVSKDVRKNKKDLNDRIKKNKNPLSSGLEADVNENILIQPSIEDGAD